QEYERRTVRVPEIGIAAGAALVLLGDGLRAVGFTALALPHAWPGEDLRATIPWLGAIAAYGFFVEPSALLPAAGAIAGARTSVSVAVGAVIGWAVLAPALVAEGMVKSPA